MKSRYTTAFIGVTISGELFIIRQHQGLNLADCAQWRLNNRSEIERLYGEVREVTIRHKDR